MYGTRKFALGTVLVGLAFTVFACETQTDDEAADMAGEMAEPAPADPTPPAATDPATTPMMVSFQPLNDSGITGEVRIEPADTQTRVVASLMGVQAQGTLQGHIHMGTCETPGSRVVALEPITTAANGAGESTSTVDLPIATVANGQHIVMYHEADGSPGQPVACAPIPQR